MSCVCNSSGSYCEYIDATCYYIRLGLAPNEVGCGPRFDAGPWSSFYIPIPPDPEPQVKKK